MRLAVLIDADNASAAVIGDILSEVASLGVANVKRIYGDFTTPDLAGWRTALIEHAIQPIQQFRNTLGKNASDSALIIDAMDLLHTRELEGFCLVSSDGDFTRLATRIREDGFPVYGFGEQKTPKSFIQACDRFTYTEIFRKKVQTSKKTDSAAVSPPLRDLQADKHLQSALGQAIEAAALRGSRANLGEVGAYLSKMLPDFDVRNYGYPKLSDLVEQLPTLKLVREKTAGGGQVVYLERK